LHAYGVNQDVDHARAMAMAVLVVCGAGFAAALTGLRNSISRWVLVVTLASMAILVQVPALSAWLHLSPLHANDWALAVVFAFVACGATHWVVARPLSAGASPGPAT
jgi:Ca2+-transporting ATPase